MGQTSRLMHHVVQRLVSGELVVLSLVREPLPDNQVRLCTFMYNPSAAREVSYYIVNLLLDKVLKACGLEDSKSITAEAVDAVSEVVVACILECVFILPCGVEFEFRLAPRMR